MVDLVFFTEAVGDLPLRKAEAVAEGLTEVADFWFWDLFEGQNVMGTTQILNSTFRADLAGHVCFVGIEKRLWLLF